MLSDELKAYTKFAHADLEKQMMVVIKTLNHKDDYCNFLIKQYGFYYSLEDKLQPFLSKTHLANYDRRRKAMNILNDLNDLNFKHQTLAFCEKLPLVNNEYHALGALYVLEGSTLGGQIISTIISKKLNMAPGKGFSFLNAYGAQTQSMWSDFIVMINATDQQYKQEVLDTANNTFTCSFSNRVSSNKFSLAMRNS